jgi:hypothetical protein
MAEIKEKLVQYLESEYNLTAANICDVYDYDSRNDAAWFACQRCSGAVSLAQLCGADEQETDTMYENFCDRIWAVANDGFVDSD